MEFKADDLRKDADACNGQAIHSTSGPALAIERRAHAALIEQHERLKKHAEAMDEALGHLLNCMALAGWEGDAMAELARKARSEYRADFPAKEAP